MREQFEHKEEESFKKNKESDMDRREFLRRAAFGAVGLVGAFIGAERKSAKAGEFEAGDSEKKIAFGEPDDPRIEKMVFAAIEGDTVKVAELLDDGVDVNARYRIPNDSWDKHGTTALMYAASEGNPELTAFLLKRGADRNLRGGAYNFTAEQMASIALETLSLEAKGRERYAEVVRLLRGE